LETTLSPSPLKALLVPRPLKIFNLMGYLEELNDIQNNYKEYG